MCSHNYIPLFISLSANLIFDGPICFLFFPLVLFLCSLLLAIHFVFKISQAMMRDQSPFVLWLLALMSQSYCVINLPKLFAIAETNNVYSLSSLLLLKQTMSSYIKP